MKIVKAAAIFLHTCWLIGACANEPDPKNEVDQLRSLSENTFDERVGTDTAYWKEVRANYIATRASIDAQYANLDDEVKREVDAMFARFDKLERKLESIPEAEAVLNQQTAKERPVGGDNETTDIVSEVFDNLPPLDKVRRGNIISYYKSIVELAEGKKDEFVPAQWDFIKGYYEHVDEIKNDYESELSSESLSEIAAYKLRFVALEVPSRISAKLKQK